MKRPATLRELTSLVHPLNVCGPVCRPVSGLAYKAHLVTRDSVYFALSGVLDGGIEGLPAAVERGAAAVVVEEAGFLPWRATRVRVADARAALAIAAAAFHAQPLRQLQTLVITGGAARVPVAHLLRSLLTEAGCRAGLIGSVTHMLGDRELPASRAALEALDVQAMAAEMVRAGCRAAVVEMPNASPPDLARLGIEPDMVVNVELESPAPAVINGVHHGGVMAAAARGTERVPRSARRLRLTDPAAGRTHAQADLAVRLEERGQAQTLMARAIHLTTRETRCQLLTPGGETSVRLPLVGRRNLHCAIAALAVAQALRLPGAALGRGLTRLRPVPGWLEPVTQRDGVPVFVDTAPNADDLAAALEALRGAGAGRLLLLVGCDRRQPSPLRSRIGEVAARLAHLTVVTSNNPGREAPERIAADVAGGYRAVRGELPPLVPDRRAAIHQLIRAARPGDCVVLAGKGHETWEEVGDCVVPFDDREHACEALEARAGRPRSHGGSR